MSVVPTQDDVWYWAMAVVSETPICVVSSFDMQLITVENTQHTHLFGLKIRWNPDQTPVADVIAKQVAREVYSVMEVQYLHNGVFPQFKNINKISLKTANVTDFMRQAEK